MKDFDVNLSYGILRGGNESREPFCRQIQLTETHSHFLFKLSMNMRVTV